MVDSSLKAQKNIFMIGCNVMILIRKKVLKSDRPRENINLFFKNMDRNSPRCGSEI